MYFPLVESRWFTKTIDVPYAYMFVCACVKGSHERALLNFGVVPVFCCLSVSRPRSLQPPSQSCSVKPSSLSTPILQHSHRLFHLASVGQRKDYVHVCVYLYVGYVVPPHWVNSNTNKNIWPFTLCVLVVHCMPSAVWTWQCCCRF